MFGINFICNFTSPDSYVYELQSPNSGWLPIPGSTFSQVAILKNKLGSKCV